jgi:hypothetical protein
MGSRPWAPGPARPTGWRLGWVVVLAIAFAYIESSVVVYLRALYYPDGFAFPLRKLPTGHLRVELVREAATLVVLAAAAMLAGARRWERFGYFAVAFGVWDLFYYVWLKVLVGWPHRVTDWDVLFLIPVPWTAPILAPALVAILLVVCGTLIVRGDEEGRRFRPGPASWWAALAATAAVLVSFMKDAGSMAAGRPPGPYRYELLLLGLVLYAFAFGRAWSGRPTPVARW